MKSDVDITDMRTKINQMYQRQSKKKIQFTSQVVIQTQKQVDKIKQNNQSIQVTHYKPLSLQKNRDFQWQTFTKWDVFQPRAFCKLSSNNKNDTFLKLYEDFIYLKKFFHSLIQEQRTNGKIKSPFKIKQKIKQYHLKTNKNKTNNFQYQNQKLKQEVKRLHAKIAALSDKQSLFGGKVRPSSKTSNQKVIFPVTDNIKLELQNEKKQTKQLLFMIDELKKREIYLQQLLNNKQQNEGQRGLREIKQNKDKNKPIESNQTYLSELQKWKNKYNDMQVCFQKMSQQKQRRIRELQNEKISIYDNNRSIPNTSMQKFNEINMNNFKQKINDLQNQKQILQRQIRRLTNLPFNQTGNNKNYGQLESKLLKLQQVIQKTKQQLTKSKQLNTKYQTQLDFKSKQLISFKNQNQRQKQQLKQLLQRNNNSDNKNLDYDDYYRKLLGLVKFQGDDPVWRKYASLATPSFNTTDLPKMKKNYEQLWLSKLQLLAHLQKAKIQLQTINQSINSKMGGYIQQRQKMQDQLRVARTRLQQYSGMSMIGNRRQTKLYNWCGIEYDDSISVFQAQQRQIKQLITTQNYLDLYIGQLVLQQAAILKNPQVKVKNIGHMVSFVTVDFYNHDTQHSAFAEGSSKLLGNNFSFKIQMNQALLLFLSRRSIQIQLWSPHGATTLPLGKGEIILRDLVLNANKSVSAVLRGKCAFYAVDKSMVGTLEYRIRTRLPIGSYLHLVEQQVNNKNSSLVFSRRRKLKISIKKGMNLPINSNSFIFFSLQGDDFFTDVVRGSQPEWNFERQIQLMITPELEQQFKQKYVQFTIFDDDKPVEQDIIGIAKADVTRLLGGTNKLQLNLQIKNSYHDIMGRIQVIFMWME